MLKIFDKKRTCEYYLPILEQSFRHRWKQIHFQELTWLLSNEALLRTSRLRDCDQELQLFRGLLHWLLHSPQTRIPHMTSRVMKFVDFKNMTHQALTRVVAKETIIMQNPVSWFRDVDLEEQ